MEQRILYIVKCFAQIDVLSTASVMMIRLISNLVPIALLVLPQIETRPEHNSFFGTGIIGFLILLLISNAPQLINLTYINKQLSMFRKRLLDFQNSAIDEYNEEQKPLHRDNNIQTLSLRNYDLFSGGQHLLQINKLDLEAPNQYVLIGKTGVGKSLFAKSIVGLYHAYKGDIFINNIDHNHWKTNGLVHSIGYIRQSPPVLNQPLLEVLGFNSEFTTKNIFEAFDFLELEAIHDMIRRDYKWNPKQAGYHLSMGERVRLAVLRVLALGAKALILDEITAHIDRNTENHLLKVLSELNILSLYISHKEETIKRFENVLTLKDSILLRKDSVSGNESRI